MLETCNSCGTVFDVDQTILSNKIQWLRCSICNEKWSVSSTFLKKFDQHKILDEEKLASPSPIYKDKSEQVKYELASIKSAVEDKKKNMSKNNPVLEAQLQGGQGLANPM